MSITFTCVPSPSVINIKKKRMAQKGAAGRRVTTSGYAIKANPGP